MVVQLVAGVALACGGFFGPPDGNVFSDAQIVRFEDLGDEVSVEYSVAYDGDPAEFGWIVPIPGAFVSVDEADAADLYGLVSATEPRIDYVAEEERGCGSSDKGGALSGGTRDNGQLSTESGTAGVFEYTAIATDDAAELVSWLDEHGWDVRGSEPSLEAYVAEGWQFVALTLTSEYAAGSVSVRLTYEGDRMEFPARMSRTSMAEHQRTTILVVGDQAATMGSWDASPIRGKEQVAEDPDDTGGGAAIYEDVLLSMGDDRRAYGIPFRGEVGGSWVTRFDTIARSDIHDVDPVLTLDGGTSADHHAHFDVYESQRAWDQAFGCGCASTPSRVGWLAPLALIAAMRRRRER